MKFYKVYYNGKIVNNYDWREPNNPNKFVLVEDGNEVNTWFYSDIVKNGWNKIPGIKIITIGEVK